MCLKALVTIDLLEAENSERNIFYEYLREKNWKKIENLTTAWKVSFTETATRSSAITTIENHLRQAK